MSRIISSSNVKSSGPIHNPIYRSYVLIHDFINSNLIDTYSITRTLRKKIQASCQVYGLKIFSLEEKIKRKLPERRSWE